MIIQMNSAVLIILAFCLYSCEQVKHKESERQLVSANSNDTIPDRSYYEIKKEIQSQRRAFSVKYSPQTLLTKDHDDLTHFWINTISEDLFAKWQNTPWDFNGITTIPRQGAIACGYFVTTILQDMDVKLNRIKLSTCASSEMMKSLAPQQPIKRLNHLSYSDFNNMLKDYGKGVYVIGLDFHTGFIVNDGKENWFIHSNYIGRKGVTKEPVSSSEALQSSKTRWLVSLTGDTSFLQKWLRR